MLDKIQALEAQIQRMADLLSERIDEREEAIRKHVADAIAAIPAPVNGKDGKDGRDGERGADGKDGAAGKDGKDGKDGINGNDGKDGRDALHLEVLPCIDADKSYPRGTYATHNGGLWRSYEKTHGLRGWECIVDGVADMQVEQHERSVITTVKMASGREIVHNARFAGVLERGIFKAGEQYEKGDGVTWAGSYWIAKKDAPEDKPGEGNGWRLAVKRGRDGKDGRNGIDMVKAVAK